MDEIDHINDCIYPGIPSSAARRNSSPFIFPDIRPGSPTPSQISFNSEPSRELPEFPIDEMILDSTPPTTLSSSSTYGTHPLTGTSSGIATEYDTSSNSTHNTLFCQPNTCPCAMQPYIDDLKQRIGTQQTQIDWQRQELSNRDAHIKFLQEKLKNISYGYISVARNLESSGHANEILQRKIERLEREVIQQSDSSSSLRDTSRPRAQAASSTHLL